MAHAWLEYDPIIFIMKLMPMMEMFIQNKFIKHCFHKYFYSIFGIHHLIQMLFRYRCATQIPASNTCSSGYMLLRLLTNYCWFSLNISSNFYTHARKLFELSLKLFNVHIWEHNSGCRRYQTSASASTYFPWPCWFSCTYIVSRVFCPLSGFEVFLYLKLYEMEIFPIRTELDVCSFNRLAGQRRHHQHLW